MSDSEPSDRGVIGPINLSKREFIAAAGGALLGSGMAGATDADGDAGKMYAGKAALSQAYNTAGNLWIGPDSAKSNVNNKSGNLYLATDTQVKYYGDGSSWNKMGVGSSSTPVPSVHTEEASYENAQLVAWMYLNGSTPKALMVDGTSYTDSDPGVVANNAIDYISNVSDVGGVIAVRDYFTGVSTKITIPGTGYFDDKYRPVQFHGAGWGSGFEMADSADLAPMVEIETAESSLQAHQHGFFNLKLHGNKTNNTNGVGVKVTDPSGHSGSVGEITIDNCFVDRWAGEGVDLTNSTLVDIISNSMFAHCDSRGLEQADGIMSNIRLELNNHNGGTLAGIITGLFADNNDKAGAVIEKRSFVTGRFYQNNQAGGGDPGVYLSTRATVLGLSDGGGNSTHANGVEFLGDDGTFIGRSVRFSNNPVNGRSAGDGNRYNGEAVAEANAESPSATNSGPHWIDFTDTGDNSGDGVYYEDASGNIHGPI